MFEVEIDGKKISVEEGASIIEAADQAGIAIPRFCYHKKLSIAANCRMCLVEVEKMGKPMPACATPVTGGMVVYTTSKKALEAQRAVMEFLLVNHPLDCPICDQGGECELQDLSLGFGRSESAYNETKRAVHSDDVGPLIETEMTRCIQCTRCVRFGEEVAGLRELGVIGRGEHEEISTYVKHFVRSELSGNIIDLCPVGALTAKPARYQGRGWEYQEHPSVSAHDAVGSNLFIHARIDERLPQREVMRVVPRENEAINEAWISDRDRFSYEGFRHESRVMQPRMKKDGEWITVDWEEALSEVTKRAHGVLEQKGAQQLAALASPNATLEELYLLQKFARALGSDNVDHRLRQQDFSDQTIDHLFYNVEMGIDQIETLNTILLVGSHVRFEQPLISHRINKAYQEGAMVLAINPVDHEFPFAVSDKIITANIVDALAEVAVALAALSGESVKGLPSIEPSAGAREIAQQLHQADTEFKVGIFLGEHALNHSQAALIRGLARCIEHMSRGTLVCLPWGANTRGAYLAGAQPHTGPAGALLQKAGLNAKALFTDQSVDAYFLLNVEPELDAAYAAEALKALNEAALVVCLTPFATPEMERYADFILPIAPYTETAGTFVNVSGAWQSFAAVSQPSGEAKPAWKVLRVLANFFELEGFDYQTAHEVRDELTQILEKQRPVSADAEPFFAKDGVTLAQQQAGLLRLAPWPMYCVDNVVRRAVALQETITEADKQIAVNPNTAAAAGLEEGRAVTAIQGASSITLTLRLDDRLAEGVAWIPSGLSETAGFGQAEVAVTLEQAAE